MQQLTNKDKLYKLTEKEMLDHAVFRFQNTGYYNSVEQALEYVRKEYLIEKPENITFTDVFNSEQLKFINQLISKINMMEHEIERMNLLINTKDYYTNFR